MNAAMKRYHEWICTRPCMYCGIEGFSQASHYQGLHGFKFGRGAGKKAHDMTVAPLCCDRPGVKGCHSRFDSNEMPSAAEDEFSRKTDYSEMHLVWEMETIISAYEAGKLPI